MLTTADVGFIEMRIAKVVGFGPPLAVAGFQCVVLEEVLVDDCDRRQEDDSAEARLLRLALTAPQIMISRQTA